MIILRKMLGLLLVDETAQRNPITTETGEEIIVQ